MATDIRFPTHTVKPQQVINYWRKPSPRSINPLGYWKGCFCLYLDLVIIEGGCLLDGYPELPLTAQMSKPTENEMGWVGSRKVYSSEGHLKKKRKLPLPVNIMMLKGTFYLHSMSASMFFTWLLNRVTLSKYCHCNCFTLAAASLPDKMQHTLKLHLLFSVTVSFLSHIFFFGINFQMSHNSILSRKSITIFACTWNTSISTDPVTTLSSLFFFFYHKLKSDPFIL